MKKGSKPNESVGRLKSYGTEAFMVVNYYYYYYYYYQQSPITQGLWNHATRPISFTFCVDNFGVKYVGHKHAEHLLSVINVHYTCSQDWDGKTYLGMDIDWYYTQKKVHVSMLEYVPEALVRFQHVTPQNPQHQLYPHAKPTYRATHQYTEAQDTS